MTRHALYRSLGARVDLRVPGFTEVVPPGFARQFYFNHVDCAAWYRKFVARLSESRGYLPLYRMSDGEFIFACGRLLPSLAGTLKRPLDLPKALLKRVLAMGREKFVSGTPGYGFETYTPGEWAEARRDYAQRVRRIASEGILAVNLLEQADGFAREYLKPFCSWLDANEIRLDHSNYFPFYFLYALLLGPDAHEFYMGRSVVVVTSDAEGGKSELILKRLLAFGARQAHFVPISRSKSMFDRIDVSGFSSIDLVLIGAGVGSLNILEQVRPLSALSLDVGYVLDCLWQPERYMGRRIFTMPDGGLASWRGAQAH